MNGNCHFVFGASLATAVAMNAERIHMSFPNIENTPETATLFILGGLLGSIFPDIDSPTSNMGKLTMPVSRWLGKVSKLFGKEMMHHRGVLHDSGLYLIGLVVSYLYFPPICGFFIGCLSHVFLDMFNPAGIPFLFGVKHFHLGTIKSGSKAGNILTWVLVASALGAGIAGRFGF